MIVAAAGADTDADAAVLQEVLTHLKNDIWKTVVFGPQHYNAAELPQDF